MSNYLKDFACKPFSEQMLVLGNLTAALAAQPDETRSLEVIYDTLCALLNEPEPEDLGA